MPHLDGVQILRAWRQKGESGRIHYIVVTADGKERRLYVEDGTGLGKVLDAALLAQEYTGPKSADEH
jgi:CheY-like chemotaxis protein